MTRLLSVAVLVLGALLSPLLGAESNPRVLIKTNAGEIRLELYPLESPQAVANFLAYVDDGTEKYLGQFQRSARQRRPGRLATALEIGLRRLAVRQYV